MVGDYIYGGHGHNAGSLTCIEFVTGKIMWQAEPLGKGSASVLYADGNSTPGMRTLWSRW